MTAAGRFAPGAGRERPPFTPRSIQCPKCGGSQSIKNEHTELVVCDSCGSHLELTREESKILGAGPKRRFEFPLDIGQAFRHQGVRYEVIARLALLEDGDRKELNRQYLLFHPTRGGKWLSEYKGNYDLSWVSHVMPEVGTYSRGRGETMETHDGRSWVMAESCRYKLAWVDGALPWRATVGDWVTVDEFAAADGSGDLYEVESQEREVEYASGHGVSIESVRQATGKRDLADPSATLLDVSVARRLYRQMLALAAAAVVINVLAWIFCLNQGKTVLRQTFAAAQLTGEVLTEPFEVTEAGATMKVVLSSPSLDNAWMAVDVAVVEGDDAVLLVTDADLEHYSGVEGGESWSEGSGSSSFYTRLQTAGTYRLLVHAVSARGEAPQAERAEHGLSVVLLSGVVPPWPFGLAAILSFASLLVVGFGYHSWKKGQGFWEAVSELSEDD